MPQSALPTPGYPQRAALPHALAVVLVCATFPLIWVGGMVTSYDAGMAVPDWPSTYGYNMFLYPWQTWLFGPFDLFIEHGHRLLGAAVGVISILLVAAVWKLDPRPPVRVLAAAVLAAVIFQGVLGGMRVVAADVQLAKVHGIFATVFFGMAIALAAVTSRWWTHARGAKVHLGAGKLHRLAIVTTALVLLQIIVGAHLRHLPAAWDPSSFRVAVFFHLLVAAVLLLHIGLLTGRVVWQHRHVGRLWRPAVALCLLMALQLGLGSAAWVVNYSWPAWAQGWSFTAGHTVQAGSYLQAMTATAHQATGSLILGVCVLLTLRCFRFVPSRAMPIASTKLLGMLA